MNKKLLRISLMKIFPLERFAHPTLPKGLLSSSSKKKMEDFARVKTIDMSMNIPFTTPTPSPLSPTSWTNYEMPRSSPSLMSTGGTTMCKSKMAINGKPPLSPTRDYSNLQLCSSDSPTPLAPFNGS